MEWEKIFANGISDKGLVSKIYKECINSTPKKQIIQWRNGQKTWIDTSPRKTTRWPTDTWKNAQHHSSPGKYKSKPQWDITSALSEWLTLTTHATTDVGEGAEKEALFCTAGGNANWCSHSGKQYGGSSKKLELELPYDPAVALLGIHPGDTGVLFQRDTCTPHVYSSTINNSQSMERAQISIDGWMDKENVVYTHTHTHTHTHNGVLLGNQKEWNLAICNYVYGTRGYYVKWN